MGDSEMKKIEFNYPPAIAKKYIDEWIKQIERDDKADERIRKIMADVATLCDLAIKHLKFENTN